MPSPSLDLQPREPSELIVNRALPNVAGIILAAGTSQRLPPAKLLLPFRGRPVLAHVLEEAMASSLSEVVLVLGHQAGEIQAALKDQLNGVKVVVNPDYGKGRSTSVRTGVQVVSEQAHVMFLLGDMPLVLKELINILIARFQTAQPLLCFPVCKGQRGHPVIYHRNLLPGLLALTEDLSGNEIIQSKWEEALKVELSDFSSQLDLDTEEDYVKICSLAPCAALTTHGPGCEA